MGLFRTLIIIGISYYVIKFVVKFYSKIRSANINRNYNNSESDNNNKKNKIVKDDLGKYVDFEDVND